MRHITLLTILTCAVLSGPTIGMASGSPPVSISMDQFHLLVESYVANASACWEPYRIAVSGESDPYETRDTRQVRIKITSDRSARCLTRLYKMARTWRFALRVKPTGVSYDPNSKLARVSLPEFRIPASTRESKVHGLMRGHRSPYLYYAFEPLWRHIYLHNTGGKRHYLAGDLQVSLPLEKAKSIDIVNNHGEIVVIVQFTSLTLADGVSDCEFSVDFPALQMINAYWVVASDTLHTVGPGKGRPPGNIILPGKPRVIGTSPSQTVKYSFQDAVESEGKYYRYHVPLMLQLGLNINGVNSAYYEGTSPASGYLLLPGLSENVTVVVDGRVYPSHPLIGPLAEGAHNLKLSEPCFGTQIHRIRINANDTTVSGYGLIVEGVSVADALVDQWVPIWASYSDPGYQYWTSVTVRLQAPASERGDNIRVKLAGKWYTSSLSGVEDFWDRLGASQFEYGKGIGVIRRSGCASFAFNIKPYKKACFFLSDDGNYLVYRELFKTSAGRPVVLTRRQLVPRILN